MSTSQSWLHQPSLASRRIPFGCSRFRHMGCARWGTRGLGWSSAGGVVLAIGTRCSPFADGMVVGMATRKVTITLDEAQLERIRGLVDAGSARSVSGFVQHAVGVALDDV